ncbi:hypothetical protein [uncultured Porticoccus sp.]|nr:hypothetical protein [uncultured Porticoccus sp.]
MTVSTFFDRMTGIWSWDLLPACLAALFFDESRYSAAFACRGAGGK